MTPSYFFTLFLCCAAFGTVIGAYCTTADYRVRHKEPLFTSPCFCPRCRHALAAMDQIPIVSWFFLKGRCHYCQAPIPKRYPLIEGGFQLFYGITFLFLWAHPCSMLVLWFGTVTAVLLFRCKKQFGPLAKVLVVFAAYHSVYGAVLLAIYAALNLI